MTLLSVVQNVCLEIGIDQPTTVVSNPNQVPKLMLALANRGGAMLAKRSKGIGTWTVLQKEHTFTTTDGTAEYSLPTDFDYLVADTLWDRANFWRLRGPLNAQEWQLYKSGIVATGPRRRVRIKPSDSSNSKAFFVDPTPGTTGDTLVFEYVSRNWCQSSGGTGQSAWAADDDTGILLEYLFELDLKWRYLMATGNDYAEAKREFELELAQALARDGGARMLNMGGTEDKLLIDEANIPDSGFGI